MKATLSVFSLTLALLVSGPYGVGHAMQDGSGFEYADADGDGTIDYEEFRAHMVDTFYRADPNRDGELADGELDVLNASRIPDADEDGDGRLDLKEFLNATGIDFHAADGDRDYQLDPEEVDGAPR